MTTLFTNGSLFDGHRYLGPGELLVDGGRIAAARSPTLPGVPFMPTMPTATRDVYDLIPKVELHCHVEGTLRPATVSELARKAGRLPR